MFLAFLAAQNLKNTIPAPLVGGTSWAGIVFLAFLAAEKLKNTIPAPLVVGRIVFCSGL